MDALQELTEKKVKAITEARSIVDKADAEKRSRTPEEEQAYSRAWKEYQDTAAEIQKAEKENEMRSALEQAMTELRTSTGRKAPLTQPGEQRAAVNNNLELEFRGKKMAFKPGTAEFNRSTDKAVEYFDGFIRGERRTADSIANDVLADGGYLHAPLQFIAILIKILDNIVFVRKYARVFPVTTSDSLGIPTMPTLYNAAAWTSELTSLTPDASAQFGQRDLKPNLLTKGILISQKLLKTAAISPEGIVADEMARIFSYAEENGFLTGNGTGQPLGVFTASANGVPTSQDVVCGASASDPAPFVTFDGLQAMKFGMLAQYRPGARWLFNRTIIQLLATVKDNYGRYIWEPSAQAGTPDILLGYPVDESEFAPNATTSGSYVGIFANWQHYWIADLVTGFEMQRLNELYALTNQVGFIGRRYVDGAPTMPAAFIRGKLS